MCSFELGILYRKYLYFQMLPLADFLKIEILSVQYTEFKRAHLTWVRALLPEQCFSDLNVHRELPGVLVKMQILICGSLVGYD